MENPIEDVRRYDPRPNMMAVERLTQHLAFVMDNNDDAKWVSVSDKREVKRVENWAHKYLKVSPNQVEKLVASVAKEMQEDTHKNRVTFYYLMAKKMGKLGDVPS